MLSDSMPMIILLGFLIMMSAFFSATETAFSSVNKIRLKNMSQMGDKDGKVMGFEMSEGMMKMMGGFTIVRLTSLMGAANVKVTKEQLLALNAELNKIPKPEKKGLFGIFKK